MGVCSATIADYIADDIMDRFDQATADAVDLILGYGFILDKEHIEHNKQLYAKLKTGAAYLYYPSTVSKSLMILYYPFIKAYFRRRGTIGVRLS